MSLFPSVLLAINTNMPKASKVTTKKVSSARPSKSTVEVRNYTRREYKLQKQKIAAKKAIANKAASTIGEIGKAAASTARNVSAGVVGSKATDTLNANRVATGANAQSMEDALNNYYNVINGAAENSGKSQNGSTSDMNSTTNSKSVLD